ncbi:hypothetical protein H0H81_005782 [Sphagnurus paluster]|uniref:Fungal-type protein kinase domain-containing protein n=1 Tax=Sphagnurus paluster TaxID=117069 RepID=A0A9P7FU49_9AGAR|nr:hypothetical protein H0H81_005782 [Sphagnurus paluster]
MSNSSRHYVTAVHVDRSKVTLWYFDRACVFRTTTFDFIEDPHKLALVMYTLDHPKCCYGFDPFLVTRGALTNNGKTLKNLFGAELFFPLKSIGKDDERFRINGVLYQAGSLLGRGTSVYSVSRISSKRVETNLALKTSWLPAFGLCDAAFLLELRHALPRFNLVFEPTTLGVNWILNDWDMACVIGSCHNIVDDDSSAKGTYPFMAIDLLQDDPPPNTYAHDLESFFYVLVWAALHFDFRNDRRRPTRPIARLWESSPHDVATASKRLFLHDDIYRGSWDAEVLDDFRGLWSEWILPIRELFRYADDTGVATTFEEFVAFLTEN